MVLYPCRRPARWGCNGQGLGAELSSCWEDGLGWALGGLCACLEDASRRVTVLFCALRSWVLSRERHRASRVEASKHPGAGQGCMLALQLLPLHIGLHPQPLHPAHVALHSYGAGDAAGEVLGKPAHLSISEPLSM